MNKKIILFIIISVVAIIGIIFVLNNKEEKVKTIQVGNYTLKLGKYKAVNAKENDSLLLLYENYFTFEDSQDEKLEFTIGEKELRYLNSPFFLVTSNDTMELEAGGGVKYIYCGNNCDNKVNNSNNNSTNNKTDVKIKESEVKNIKLVNYNGGEFTMKIPDGWKVSKGGTGMFYGIRVYDPKDDRNQVFYILKEQPFYKSANAENLYKLSIGYSTGIYIGGQPTTEQIFKVNNNFANKAYELQSKGNFEYKGFEFPTINNFNVIESYEGNSVLHNNAVDDKILRATFNNGSSMNDGESEGLFSACVVDFGTLGYGNDQFSYYMAYNVSGITTAKDKLIEYKEILLESLNSIAFSTGYAKTTVDGINKQTNNSLNVSKQLNQAYKSYNDAWSNRQKSYDIMSQKRSDATLGYERVYDIETGEIYKAYNGFTDDYKGNRYKAISDSQYTEKIAGYIEK